MLVLTREVNQEIHIGDDISIVLVSISGRKARIGIKAPLGVPVHRAEVVEKIKAAERKKREGS